MLPTNGICASKHNNPPSDSLIWHLFTCQIECLAVHLLCAACLIEAFGDGQPNRLRRTCAMDRMVLHFDIMNEDRVSPTAVYILQLKLEDLKQTRYTNSSQIVHVKTFYAHVQ